MAAVGPACDGIRRVIRDLGVSDAKAARHIWAVEEEEQRRQKREIDGLAFLVSHFLPRFKVEHLERLDRGESFPYQMHPGFERELRHLWELNFIAKRSAFKIAEMPEREDLGKYFTVTGQGRVYMRLRQEVQAKAVG